MIRTRRQASGAFALCGALLVVLTFLPFVPLARELFTASSADLAAMLASRTTWALLGRSLRLATAATAITLLLGAPLGVLLAVCDLPFRRAIFLVHAFPLFVPPFLVALGWSHLFGRGGIVGSDATTRVLYSEAGAIAVLSLTFAPVVSALVALQLQSIDRSIAESARLVARPLRVAAWILLPLARPAMLLAAIIVFALSFSELGVPMFLRVGGYPAAVLARLGGMRYAPGEALALVLPLVAIATLLLAVERHLLGRRSFAVFGPRSRERWLLSLGRARVGLTLGAVALVTVQLFPLLALLVRGRSALGAAASAGAASLLTSAVTSISAASVVIALGLVVGHALARGARGARLLDAFAVFAFVTPASVLGVGVIAVWNRPWLDAVYGSWAILVVGLAGRYAVLGVRGATAATLRAPASAEEAAAVAGASYFRRLAGVVVPMGGKPLLGAWFLAVVFAFRDLDTTVLFYPPGEEPLTVRIFTLEANGGDALVAALAVLHVAATASLLAMGGVLVTRGRT